MDNLLFLVPLTRYSEWKLPTLWLFINIYFSIEELSNYGSVSLKRRKKKHMTHGKYLNSISFSRPGANPPLPTCQYYNLFLLDNFN